MSNWQRFTERARRAVLLAQDEAGKLNSDHVGTEHLLLGLLREKEGVAALVLEKTGLDFGAVREAILAKMPPRDESAAGEPKLTSKAKRVLEYAAEESALLNHRYIGTEHLLLALFRVEDGLAAGVLELLGVSAEKVRGEVIGYLGPGDQSTVAAIEPKLGTAVKRVLELAAEEAKGAGQPAVETEHLLLALLRVENGRAPAVLRELGVTLEDIRRRLGEG